MTQSASRNALLKLLANEHNLPGYQRRFVLPGKWMGLLQQGNVDINDRPIVKNPDGTVSTVRSITVTDNRGRAYLLPTVINDHVLSNQDALAHYQQTGQHLGVFANERAADHYAQALHLEQARYYVG